jgi:hypothetical protein
MFRNLCHRAKQHFEAVADPGKHLNLGYQLRHTYPFHSKASSRPQVLTVACSCNEQAPEIVISISRAFLLMILEFTRRGTAEREFASRFGGQIFLWTIFSEGEKRCTLDKISAFMLD